MIDSIESLSNDLESKVDRVKKLEKSLQNAVFAMA
jgi:hypothetical protein